MELEPKLIRRHLEEQIVKLVPIEQPWIDESRSSFLDGSLPDERLAELGWEPADLDLHLRRPEALRRFAKQRFAPGLEERFLASKGSRDLVIYSLLRVRDYALARELWIRLEEDETTFAEAARQFGEGPEADRQGVIGPIPIGALQPPLLQEVLRGLKAGEMSPPIGLGEWQLLLRLEKLTPSRLDESVRDQMIQESLDQFLDERVSKILAGEGDSLEPFHYDPES
ncbi:peptidylprolyl isomerase [Synechococcus sp. BS55D]|uniref:peptidylprolyl isomerase n=1 Tax=Synechococcus sp. BS55D TaxID=2055943 RepID=UPI00103906EC|nr:peptidylprolyl isomerase [Synechococcus sp. BS55D]TCD58127.1 hypothetical protein CWE16_02165 [Synechococcus sp. BS55D]